MLIIFSEVSNSAWSEYK